MGPRKQARDIRDCWSMAGAHRPKRETPGKAVRHRGPSGTVRSHPGQLVVTTGPRERARIAQESSSTPRIIGPERDSPGRACRNRNRGPSTWARVPRGMLVDSASSRTRARITRGSWATPWALGHGPESPGPPGGHRADSGTVPSHPGRLVDTAVLLTRAQVTRDSWSTQRDIGHGPESPGTAGRPWDLRP